MSTNTARKFLPVTSGEKKLDISVIDDEAVVSLSTWTDGLGWCTQKTMSLDAEMLDELHRVIAAARIRLKSESCEGSSKVIEFPAVGKV
jgi:hypothetical protein